MRKICILLLAFAVLGCNMASNTLPTGASGGVSIISYLQKVRDGVVFQETFENSNFIAADGWSVLRGSPANSQAQAVAGISSWDNSAGNQSFPIAYKNITDSNVDLGLPGWYVQTWFYDPITSTSAGSPYTTSTYPGPYFKIQTNDGNYRSIGVRNAISSTSYSFASGSTLADAPTSASSVARTNGWHNLCIYMGDSDDGPNYLNFLVDNNLINLDYSPGKYVTGIYLCAGTSADSGQSFGYFDNTGYFRNIGVQINESAPYLNTHNRVNMYDENNNLSDSKLESDGEVILFFSPNSDIPPIGSYFEICNPKNSSVIDYRSPLLQVNPGDIYQFNTINFGRKCTMYDPMIKELQSVNISTAGVRETNNYGLKGTISFAVNSLQGWSWKQAADNFFLNCVQGNSFALMVDNVTDSAFGVIATSAFGGTSNTVQIMSNDYTNPISNFTVGNYYYVRNNANTQKQLMNLVSMSTSTSTLTFDQNLNFNVNPLDYVYSLQLYPFLEIQGDTQSFKCTSPSIPRFTWQQACNEYNNG